MPEPQHEHHEHHDEHDDDRDQDIFPTVLDSPEDAADAAALARAEQAVARHGGTPEEREGVARAATARRAEERLERWQAGR